MKYKFSDITASYTTEKRRNTSLWARIFSRPLSFITAYIFANLGFSANAVSIISLLEAFVACAFIMIGGKYTLVGIILFLLWDVLDCTDGNIARLTHTSSPVGVFFDAAAGYAAVAFIYLSVGVEAYRTSDMFGQNGYVFIIIGAASSILDLLARIVYQKYTVTEYVTGNAALNGTVAEKLTQGGAYHFALQVMKNLTYSCLFMPLLVLAYIFNRFDILILFYACYSLAFYVGSTCFLLIKASKLKVNE